MPLSPLTRRRLMASAAAAFAAAGNLIPLRALAAEVPSRDEALAAMKRATTFMVEKAAYNGGYVWSYLPDFSRRWGEMEAFPTMIWVQPPGTATMGHLFLDAYHATGDAYYYEAAVKAAKALIAIQHPAGGWNYIGDMAGEASLKRWYDTIGKNGWRLEEFQHYYGNATFDDAGTAESSQFLLRLYAEKQDAAFKPALDKALQFVLDSQYPVGGWPQRFPLKDEFHHHGKADYTGYITFNDDVAGENLKFLIMVWQVLGDTRVLPAIHKAMDCFLACQQPQPQPAWGLQHRVNDLKPAGARSYEPEAFATHTTGGNIAACMDFYELTGDPKYLARLGEALDWLDSVKLPVEIQKGRPYPTFIEIGTGKPLYIHRTGSNVVNGRYYADQNPTGTVIHYSSFRSVNVASLRQRLATLKATPPEVASRNSPLKGGRRALPKYFTTGDISVSDLNVNTLKADSGAASPAKAAALIAGLNAEGWWPTELKATSNPYIGDGSATPAPGDFSQTRVGDATDTSPYITDMPKVGISTGGYIENMSTLIKFIGV
ncbi:MULTISPECIES: pectate lyase [unclassified Caulobacter]|uniref:pectate lyase n=1 Tax=unclassified Caulobacter TaxID=2648921 RepID=UPI000D369B1E|nr:MULTISPECIES: pectate lyase [unclassified Caulobacter]PTS89077.1 pectate lyase [Caulobacter sp. HMWF009]PTT05056.1 pectate lyase [Caulobacter sp. HMWF025]